MQRGRRVGEGLKYFAIILVRHRTVVRLSFGADLSVNVGELARGRLDEGRLGKLLVLRHAPEAVLRVPHLRVARVVTLLLEVSSSLGAA